jgi:hypothetical protein
LTSSTTRENCSIAKGIGIEMTIIVINNMKIGTKSRIQDIRDKEGDKASTRLDTRGNQKERKKEESRHRGIGASGHHKYHKHLQSEHM